MTTERYTWGGDQRDRMDFTTPDPRDLAILQNTRLSDVMREVNEAVIGNIVATWGGVKNSLHPVVVATLTGNELREHRRRCDRCPSPPGYPKPLRVNGADYQRRRNNRRGRNR